ncbi:hypothetical protein L1887_56844 [Cichorium endivia]|nr:hypothetical protein L1887_56844 [Cichorium endivia]
MTFGKILTETHDACAKEKACEGDGETAVAGVEHGTEEELLGEEIDKRTVEKHAGGDRVENADCDDGGRVVGLKDGADARSEGNADGRDKGVGEKHGRLLPAPPDKVERCHACADRCTAGAELGRSVRIALRRAGGCDGGVLTKAIKHLVKDDGDKVGNEAGIGSCAEAETDHDAVKDDASLDDHDVELLGALAELGIRKLLFLLDHFVPA